MLNNWQDRIYNHEEVPPKGIWKDIAKKLDESDNDKKVIVEKKSLRISYLKWAVAASLLLALISIAVVYMNKKETTPENIASQQNNTVSKNALAQNSQKTDTNPVNASSKKDSLALKTSPLKSKKIKSPFINNPDEQKVNFLYADAGEIRPLVKNPTEANKEKLTNASGEVINDISLMESPNTYVSFIGPNGQEVKISSKFSNIIGYLNNPETEEYLDKVISEASYWRGKFKLWRDKMSENTIAPSPSNFMDMIELGKILSENK